MNDSEFRTLLDWFMVSDPWPLAPADNARMEAMLNREAASRGYTEWIEAFHEHMKPATTPSPQTP